MKNVISHLRVSQKVWALVEEVTSENRIVVNFSGDLIGVRNDSTRILRVGQRIQLKVVSVSPLKFELVSAPLPNRGIGRLDMEI